jgi:AraC family transcriptional regulator
MLPAAKPLFKSVFLSGRAYRYEACAASPPLSIKTMSNGVATYRTGRRHFAVDETGYLVLNNRQPYEIEINSHSLVESFVVFFPQGWAEETLRALISKNDSLLSDPYTHDNSKIEFFEKLIPHDRFVSPIIHRLQKAYKRGDISEIYLEENLRNLLEGLLRARGHCLREIDTLPNARAATRREIWVRVNRARDFIRAHSHQPLTLKEISSTACLSPFHCLRTFKQVFGQTPGEFLSSCRSERAVFLLDRTMLPITEISGVVGFESLGSFITWFRSRHGFSPLQFRRRSK